MSIRENIAEGLRSIKGNMLRTVITAAIIAFGIMSLVGILTTIDGIQSSVDQSFESLGVNSFDIKIENQRGRRRGISQKQYPPIYFREAMLYKELFTGKTDADVSISTGVAGAVEVKFESLKTNPNTQVIAIDENYLSMKGYKLQNGRDINSNDVSLSSKVVIIGNELAKTLFPKTSPLDKVISMMGNKYRIVGVLEKKGSLTGGGDDRVALLPLETGRQFDTNGRFSYDITTASAKVENIDYVIGEATATMRRVRGDEIGEDDSFIVERADAFLEDVESITDNLRIGGIGISFITLLGASIALMNIMMVSVTERTREIGVRKALGASPQKIRFQFLIEAIVICLIGGIGGIILGLAMGNIVANFIGEGAVFVVPWGLIAVGIMVCITVGLISGVYPAIKASRLDPIESLRYE
jgi:putative ABC transport system permease protein